MKSTAIIVSALVISGLLGVSTWLDSANAVETTPDSVLVSQARRAVPAPLFRPVQQIWNELPSGYVMRLPSVVPDASEYAPDVWSSEGTLTVSLAANTSGCIQSIRNGEGVPGFCLAGNIRVSALNSRRAQQFTEWYPPNTRQTVILANGIEGFYSQGAQSASGYFPFVAWQQEGMFYEVMLRGGSRQDIIDTAVSMSSEPPLTR